jgi:hypothetical protein
MHERGRRRGSIPSGRVNFMDSSGIAHYPRSMLVAVASLLFASCGNHVNDGLHREDFALVSGVRLHYIDWGGRGDCPLFLTPLGGDVLEQFGSLAPQFSDRFRVLGLTRRGQGRSDKPQGDYDTGHVGS